MAFQARGMPAMLVGLCRGVALGVFNTRAYPDNPSREAKKCDVCIEARLPDGLIGLTYVTIFDYERNPRLADIVKSLKDGTQVKLACEITGNGVSIRL